MPYKKITLDKNRDLIGYGQNTPQPQWHNGARIAVQFVLNYEEGGENCVLYGDTHSEKFLSEIIGAEALLGIRHMNMESIYEYGARAGFWRLHRLLTHYKTPVTVFGVAMALAKNPAAVSAMQKADWEIASHGLRWIDYSLIPEAIEADHIAKAIEIHKQATGALPEGWYIGRTSPNSRRLLLEAGNWLYDADSYADDLPYWVKNGETPHLIIPYTLDANDMRFATAQGFNCSDQFYTYLKDTFDTLYAEGETHPKMMSIGLHCRLIGRPGRITALARFLEYINNHSGVWCCRRSDIARHWRKHSPPHDKEKLHDISGQ